MSNYGRYDDNRQGGDGRRNNDRGNDRYNEYRGGNDRGDNYDSRGHGGGRRQDDRYDGGSRGGNHGNYQQDYGGRDGGHRGGSNYHDDVSDRMSTVSIGSNGSRGGGSGYRGGRGGGRGGRGGNYSQSGGGSYQGRGFQSSGSERGGSSGSGSGSRSGGNGMAPIAKKDLPYNSVVFEARPKTMIQDKKLGTKLIVKTNHAQLCLPHEPLVLNNYNIDVTKNRKEMKKREEAGPVFWDVFNKTKFRHRLSENDIIFNDVNQLWSLKKLPDGDGDLVPRPGPNGRKSPYAIRYKFTGTVNLAQEIAAGDQQSSVMATMLDAIMTSRSRHPDTRQYTVFKRMTFLVSAQAELSTKDNQFEKYIKWGLDARVGFSFAVKMNLRAGLTTCFDISHTLFTKPGYPLIRLMIELCEKRVISDEDYEAVWDSRLKDVRPDRVNRDNIHKILKGMSLTYCMTSGSSAEDAERKSKLPVDPRARPGRDIYSPRDFKYFELGDSADREQFRYYKNPNDPNEQGRLISVAEFYLLAHGITLRYPMLPCIVKKPSKKNVMKISYPMEMVSYIVNPTRYEGFSPESLRSQLVRDTTYTPQQRLELLEEVIGQKPLYQAEPVLCNEDVNMRQHGVSIEKTMLTAQATLLPVPTVVYGDKNTFTDSEHTGVWEAVRENPIRPILEGGDVETGGARRKKVIVGSIIVVHNPNYPQNEVNYDMESYHRLMHAVSETGQEVYWLKREKNIAFVLDEFHFRKTDHPNKIREHIQEKKNLLATDKGFQSDDYVMVPLFFLLFDQRCSFFPQHNNDYNLLKHFCDNTEGVYTQGMLVDNFNNISANPLTCRFTCHLVEKILGKIGTIHRKLQRNGSHKAWTKLTDPAEPTLMLGIDVSHPKAADLTSDRPGAKMSIASVVGNIDFDMCHFRSSPRIQDTGEEQIVRMEDGVTARLTGFIENTKTRPAHIVVYRDGLSEGDFKKIMYEEVNSIESACVKIAADYKPTITYIVVSKRHHTKFFPENPDESYEQHAYNVKPGTLIEDVVTTKDYYDFFLATQVGQMGTSKPTHYFVLKDTWAPLDSFWPTITHALTYAFCRTTTTIALPAPVMYAHLAAKRAKEAYDAALWYDYICKPTLKDPGLTSEQTEKTAQIHMNKNLDGMVFV